MMPGSKGELKWVDVNQAPIGFGTASVTGVLLNGIVPGTGASQRIGRRATFKTLNIRSTWTAGIAGANVFQGRCKMWVVVDTQPNATIAVGSDIFVTTGQTAANALANLDNRDRFKVLAKKTCSHCSFLGEDLLYIYLLVYLPPINNPIN